MFELLGVGVTQFSTMSSFPRLLNKVYLNVIKRRTRTTMGGGGAMMLRLESYFVSLYQSSQLVKSKPNKLKLLLLRLKPVSPICHSYSLDATGHLNFWSFKVCWRTFHSYSYNQNMMVSLQRILNADISSRFVWIGPALHFPQTR